MSDPIRNIIGTGLILLSLFLLSEGILPIRKEESFGYTGKGAGNPVISPIPHLADSDILNIGNEEELTTLPGIGPYLSGMIKAEREENGLFRYPEDLISVKGIGSKRMEQIRPMLLTEADESEE